MATYRALLSLKSSLDDPDSRLSALRLLNLSNNIFNRTFPPELSNLTNLRVLDLYNNNLTGVLPVSVATFHCFKSWLRHWLHQFRPIDTRYEFEAAWKDMGPTKAPGKTVWHIIPTRGLGQGDPISLYLYFWVAEGFSALLRKAERDRLLYEVSIATPSVKHKFFADDSLLFCNATIQDCLKLMLIFAQYEKAS
ncbi:hypothetical protein ACLB2K_006836 [Fragaria x ananassa]